MCDPWGLDFQQQGGVLDQVRRPTTHPPRANTLGGTSQSCAVPMGISICLPVAMNTKLVHANVRLGVFCMVNFVHDRGMLFNRLKQSH